VSGVVEEGGRLIRVSRPCLPGDGGGLFLPSACLGGKAIDSEALNLFARGKVFSAEGREKPSLIVVLEKVNVGWGSTSLARI